MYKSWTWLVLKICPLQSYKTFPNTFKIIFANFTTTSPKWNTIYSQQLQLDGRIDAWKTLEALVRKSNATDPKRNSDQFWTMAEAEGSSEQDDVSFLRTVIYTTEDYRMCKINRLPFLGRHGVLVVHSHWGTCLLGRGRLWQPTLFSGKYRRQKHTPRSIPMCVCHWAGVVCSCSPGAGHCRGNRNRKLGLLIQVPHNTPLWGVSFHSSSSPNESTDGPLPFIDHGNYSVDLFMYYILCYIVVSLQLELIS